MAQILVLGSHHTGTSIVTRLLMEMGCFADEPNLKMLPGNPLKYFEHHEALSTDIQLLGSGMPPKPHGPFWLNYGFESTLAPASAHEAFAKRATHLVQTMDAQALAAGKKAWVLKDPRMSLLAREWLPLLEEPICVLVSRNPLETSRRLAEKYNVAGQELTVHEWTLVWEEFMVNAIRACLERGAPIVYAQHLNLVTSPYDFANTLFNSLTKAIGPGLVPIPRERITELLGSDFVTRAKPKPMDALPDHHGTILTDRARAVWHHLARGEVRAIPRAMLSAGHAWGASSMAALSHPNRAAHIRHGNGTSNGEVRSSEAYATIVTSNDRGFVAGALVLAATIRTFDKKRDLVAMLSVEADDPIVRQALEAGGWTVFPVAKLEEPWYNHHPNCRAFTPGQQVRWGRMFSKLRIYSLSYRRVVYLDTDTMVHRELDPWFLLPGDFYAERSPSHRGVNAGIMVIRPSERVLEQLIDYARQNPPMVFWPSQQVGCTEQELLNRFWGGEQAFRKLNDTRHFDYLDDRFTKGEGREENRLRGPRVSHCLTTKCNKPWDVRLRNLVYGEASFNSDELQAYCDPAIYVAWHRVFWSLGRARHILFPPYFTDKPKGLQEELTRKDLDWLASKLGEEKTRAPLFTNVHVEGGKLSGFKLG